uniref:Uncharacterized protein n=1 Tax=Romanomermis culicivorax TaxID=13658 RepID=A0A915KRW7_ROMCU
MENVTRKKRQDRESSKEERNNNVKRQQKRKNQENGKKEVNRKDQVKAKSKSKSKTPHIQKAQTKGTGCRLIKVARIPTESGDYSNHLGMVHYVQLDANL